MVINYLLTGMILQADGMMGRHVLQLINQPPPDVPLRK